MKQSGIILKAEEQFKPQMPIVLSRIKEMKGIIVILINISVHAIGVIIGVNEPQREASRNF
jgi:hypothetical protein